MNHTINQLVNMALLADKKTISDRRYLIAWVWVRETMSDKDPGFQEKVLKGYEFLLKHHNPYDIVREKDKILSKDSYLKACGEDTEALQRYLRDNQPQLPLEPKDASNSEFEANKEAGGTDLNLLGRQYLVKLGVRKEVVSPTPDKQEEG